MNHYVKITNVEFKNGELNFRLQFQPVIEGQNYYDDIHFDKIYVDTDRTFECKTNWSQMASEYTVGIEGQSEPFDFTEKTETIFGITYRCVDVKLSVAYDENTINEYKAFSLSNTSENIYFIYVTMKGDYNPLSPLIIQAQPKQTEFFVYHEVKLYDRIFEVVSEALCNQKCDGMDIDAANQIIFFNGFTSSMNTGQIPDGIKFWKLIHKDKTYINKKCNCNG